MVVFIVNQSLCRVVLIAELHCIVISLYMNLPVDLIDKFELSNTIGFKWIYLYFGHFAAFRYLL